MSPARFAFAAAIIAAAVVVVAFLLTTTISHSLIGIWHTVGGAFSSIGFVIADTLSGHPFKTTIATVVPLSVPTRVAWQMMGISNAYGYELIKKGELDSYLEGRIRKVVVASIHDYIGRRLKAEKKRKDPARTAKATAARMEQYANGVQPPRRGKRREPVPIAAAPAKPLPITETLPVSDIDVPSF